MNRKTLRVVLGSVFLITGLSIGIFLVQKAVRFFSGASGIPANLVIDMSSDYGEDSDAWRNLAQGGEDKGRMLLPVVPQIKSLHPQYIRIDHVLDYYDQGTLDLVIGDILATGAKPFIALSYMPPAISKTGSVTDLPRNWIDWENATQKLIEHISGKSGLAISGVYYEVWNEPDLFGNFKYYGDKNYLDLYRHSVIGAGRAANVLPFKIGGPGTTGFYSNWMNAMLGFVSKNGLRLDFLSWHKYSKNLVDFEIDTANARNLLTRYNLNGREMVITEMGPNGENDPVYDSLFGAIHEIAVSTILQNEVARTFTFEIKDGAASDKKLWGRWGLYTNEKFGTPSPKPRASAFVFLNNMIGGRKLNVFGQGSWVRSFAKKINDTTTRILVVNYDPAGVHNENVPIKLANLPSQSFKFKRINFLGETTATDVFTVAREWATQEYMRPNSAAIFEVTTR